MEVGGVRWPFPGQLASGRQLLLLDFHTPSSQGPLWECSEGGLACRCNPEDSIKETSFLTEAEGKEPLTVRREHDPKFGQIN